MRVGILAGLLAVLVCAAVAQPTQTMLTVSDSLAALRISNAEEQLRRFSPLLTLIDGVMASDSVPGHPETKQLVTKASQTLQTMVSTLKTLPGVNAKGELWVVVMPPAAPPAPADGAKPVLPTPPVYVLLPLKDPAAFKTFLETKKVPLHLAYSVCGNYAVGAADRKPHYTCVNINQPLITTRQLAVSLQVANFTLATVPANLPPLLATLLQPMDTVLKEQQRNVQRVEMGLTMTGKDLSMESYTVPVPGSPLAKSLADGVTTALPAELAACLPERLSYSNASDPMLPGSPGLANILLRVAVGILGAFLPPERYEPLQRSFDRLMIQCSQGRAIGITAPNGPDSGANLVAVYRISKEAEARDAVQRFITELAATPGVVTEDMWSNSLAFALTPGAEKIDGQSIDLVTVTVTPPPVPVKPEDPKAVAPAPIVIPPFTIECRLAYQGTKMLVAMGPQSQAEMTALLQRVKGQSAGFTASERYQAIKEAIPPKARGFESVTLLTFCQVMSSWIPPGKQRDDLCRLLSVFPPQQTAILLCQEIQPGRLRGTLTIPGEQLDFLYSLLKAGQQLGKRK